MRFTCLTAAVLSLAAGLASADLVTNGDFSSGNTGFTTDYLHNSGANAGLTTPPLSGAGVYGIVTSSQFWHQSFTNFGDHTTGSGNMMIVNGTNVANKTVWQQGGIAVTSGQTYRFSFWARSAYSASPAVLNLTTNINGQAFTFNLSSNTGAWQQFSMDWTATNNGPASVRIVDTNTELNGNDFAIDDLSMIQVVPLPPAAWAGLSTLAGVVGLGLVRRRKLRVA